jgi:hypothetical protein
MGAAFKKRNVFSSMVGIKPAKRLAAATRRHSPRKSHKEGPLPHGHEFKAGERVRESGIYEAIHESAHRETHDVVMIQSDLFPPCDTCADRVRFRLIRTAPYIFTDEDFEKSR